MTALAALAAAAVAPPETAPVPAGLEAAIREACAGAWRAVEVVLAGDMLRGRLGKTRDAIVRDAVESVLALHGNAGLRADALTALHEARDAGELDGALDLAAVIAETRSRGAVAVGRAAVTTIRRDLASYHALEKALADAELASLLVDAARAIFRALAHDPELAPWAIGPTGSPGRDRALAAFAELASSPGSLAELETLIALPIHLDDNVQFTVYRPRVIDPGRWHQLLAFAHLAERRPGEDDLPDPLEEVQRQAAAALGDKANQYQPIVQDSGAAIPEEGELTFVPEFPGIEVNPPRRSFSWLETVHREEFRIRAGRELDGKMVRGRVTVFLGHIAIAEVACAIKVDAARPEPKREPTSVRAYRKIFASYSHRDLEIVNQFETYARALGDEYLRDWVHLRTGEVWTDRLCQLIDQSDAFQLFWSRNSMSSRFVRQEYEYALSLNRPSFVRPTYWEDPMPTAPGLPPEALLRLHFQKLGSEMIGDEKRDEATRRKKRAEGEDTVAFERERAPLASLDEEADVTDPRPIETVRMPQREPVMPEALKESASISPEPGIGAVKLGAACAKCGVQNPTSARFCLYCGATLEADHKAKTMLSAPPSAPAPALAPAPAPKLSQRPASMMQRSAPAPRPASVMQPPASMVGHPPALEPSAPTPVEPPAISPIQAPVSPWAAPSPRKDLTPPASDPPELLPSPKASHDASSISSNAAPPPSEAVSPYAATAPHTPYDPFPDPKQHVTASISAAETSELPPERRSILPLVLIALGLIALIAILWVVLR